MVSSFKYTDLWQTLIFGVVIDKFHSLYFISCVKKNVQKACSKDLWILQEYRSTGILAILPRLAMFMSVITNGAVFSSKELYLKSFKRFLFVCLVFFSSFFPPAFFKIYFLVLKRSKISTFLLLVCNHGQGYLSISLYSCSSAFNCLISSAAFKVGRSHRKVVPIVHWAEWGDFMI